MKLYLSILFFLVFFGNQLMAQSQVIGFVKERITKKPIHNVNVYNRSTKEFAVTDLYDKYNKFKLLPAAQRVLPSLKVNEAIKQQ